MMQLTAEEHAAQMASMKAFDEQLMQTYDYLIFGSGLFGAPKVLF